MCMYYLKKQERCFSPPVFVNISLFMKKNLYLAEKLVRQQNIGEEAPTWKILRGK